MRERNRSVDTPLTHFDHASPRGARGSRKQGGARPAPIDLRASLLGRLRLLPRPLLRLLGRVLRLPSHRPLLLLLPLPNRLAVRLVLRKLAVELLGLLSRQVFQPLAAVLKVLDALERLLRRDWTNGGSADSDPRPPCPQLTISQYT